MGALLGQVSLLGRPVATDRFRAALQGSVLTGAQSSTISETSAACLGHLDGESASPPDSPTTLLDGTLYQRDDLAHRLGGNNSGTIADLVSRSWARWGPDAPQHFYGDFAVALHDTRDRQVILLRDHVGTRPLYWHVADGIVSFATFLPDLIALLSKCPEPNEEAVAAYLYWPTAIGARTFFSDVHSVEPGHAVYIDDSGSRAVRWWRPEEAPEIRHADPQAYGEAFTSLTEDAVAQRLPPGQKVGAHLSGGLDSTTVALMAARTLRAEGRDLTAAYCWSPPISQDAPEIRPDDERRRVEKICEIWDLPIRWGPRNGQDTRDFLARPFEWDGLANLADEVPILRQAAEDGTQIILSGWGGDEAFSSHAFDLPAWLLARGKLGKTLRLARAHGGFRRPKQMTQFLWRNAIAPLLPDELFRRSGVYSRAMEKGCFPSTALAGIAPESSTVNQIRFRADPRAHMLKMLGLHHLGDRMATWAAWGAPLGIAYQYPLADRRIIEFALGVPREILWGDGRSRFLARSAIRNYLGGDLVKSDPANQRKRYRSFFECWHLLAEEARRGAFDADCSWLDMPTLRQTIQNPPETIDALNIGSFARLAPAIRAWHMADRLGVLSGANTATGSPEKRRAG